MYQSLLLPAKDVAALRATLALSPFSALYGIAPSLELALAHPQPDFTGYLPLVQDAIGEVCSNTNYPEDWDDLSDAVDEARSARREFDKAARPAPTAAVSPLAAFILVIERMGSNDGPRFGEHVYFDFASARAALKALVDEDFDSTMDPDLELSEFGDESTTRYGFNLCCGGSVSSQYYLKRFAPEACVPASTAEAA